jgi:hypothetical protein
MRFTLVPAASLGFLLPFEVGNETCGFLDRLLSKEV